MAPETAGPTPETMHLRFEEHFNAADVDALVALYEAGAILIPSPGTTASGRDAIRAALQQFLLGRKTIRLKTTGAYVNGDIALTHSLWTLTGTDQDGNPVDIRGTSSEVLHRQADGTWRYIIDNPFVA